MTTCKFCNQKTDFPCGPKDNEVCPSCWLAIGASDEAAKCDTLDDALCVSDMTSTFDLQKIAEELADLFLPESETK